MNDPLELVYEGRGFSGTIDLAAWLDQAADDDVSALMDMSVGVQFADAPYGLQSAYRDLAGADASVDPEILVFRDQTTLLCILRTGYPLLWEAASGCALRCGETSDMFGDLP